MFAILLSYGTLKISLVSKGHVSPYTRVGQRLLCRNVYYFKK